MTRRGRVDTPLLAILIVAAAARVWGLRFGLPNTLARPDELAVVAMGVDHLNGHWSPDFFDYPRLYIYLLALVDGAYYLVGRAAGWFDSTQQFVQVFRTTRWGPLFVLARAVSAAAGTLTVLPVYFVTRRLFDRTTALVAALFVALAYLHVRDSHYGTTDATMTLLVLLAILALVRAYQEPSTRWFAATGVLAGLAAATKYNAALLAVPMALSGIVRVVDATGARLRALRHTGVPTMAIAMIATFLALSSYILWDYDRFVAAMRALEYSYARGMSGGIDLGSGWWFHVRVSLRYGLGLPLLAASLGGLAYLAVRRWRVFALVASFPLAFYVVAGDSRLLFVRYMMPAVPFLCIAAAVATVAVGRWLAPRARLAQPVAMAALAMVLVAPSALRAVAFDRLLARTDSRVLASRWMHEHVPPGSTIYQTGTHYGWVQFEDGPHAYTSYNYNRDSNRFRVGGDWAPDLPQWIVVQKSPIPYSHDLTKEFDLTLRNEYVLAFHVRASRLSEARRVYDVQDAFYLPYAGFRNVTRPGPNLYIWRRKDLPAR